MKIALFIISSFLFASVCVASDSHDADRGIEGTLRATLNDKHVHVHVDKGIVTVDGRVRSIVERDRIESIVRHTSGVVALKDDLKVTSPTPGIAADFPPGIPVYARPAPEIEVVPGAPVVTRPAPVIIPEYPKLKVEAWSVDDERAANRIARQLRADDVPTADLQDVHIMVREGNVSLQGEVDSRSAHDELIASLQRAGGARAIYDQLTVR